MKRQSLRLLNPSISRNIILLIVAATVFTVAIQLFYAMTLYAYQNERSTQKSLESIRQTDSELNKVMARLSKTGMSLAYNEAIQRFLLLQNEQLQSTLTIRASLRDKITHYLGVIVDSNEFIDDVAIITNRDEITSTYAEIDYVTVQALRRDFNLMEASEGFFTPMLDYHSVAGMNKDFAFILPVYQNLNYAGVRQRIGTVIIWCNQLALQRIVDNTTATEHSTVAIIDSKGDIVASHSERTLPDTKKMLAEVAASYNEGTESTTQKMNAGGVSSYVMLKMNYQTNWQSVNITPLSDIFADTRKLLYLGIILAFITIAISLTVAISSIQSIAKPISVLIRALKGLVPGDSQLKLNRIKNNEFGIIIDSFNGMLQNVKELQEESLSMQRQLYETELMQKETELLALRSKIDPHFLNNTLECIRSIALIRNAKEISSITSSMARIFRYSTTDNIFTTIEDELKCIADYEKIMAIRYNDRVQIRAEVKDEILTCKMLKLSLQPLIENAVYHGLPPDGSGISVAIKGTVENGYVILTVEDNGVGMSEQELEQVNRQLASVKGDLNAQLRQKASHVGISNIHARIKLYYGLDCGIMLERSRYGGVIVSMRLSLKVPDVPITGRLQRDDAEYVG